MTTAARQILSPGQRTSRRAGQALITIQATDTGTYTVTTEQGAYRVEDWCRAYATYNEARTAAEHTRQAFRTHRTDVALEARREHLAHLVMEQERRMLRRMHDQPLLDAARAEYDTLLTLADLALLQELRARHAA